VITQQLILPRRSDLGQCANFLRSPQT